MSLSFPYANILKDLCLDVASSMLRRWHANVKTGVGTSADAARRSACATMISISYGPRRKLSDIAHSCVPRSHSCERFTSSASSPSQTHTDASPSTPPPAKSHALGLQTQPLFEPIWKPSAQAGGTAEGFAANVADSADVQRVVDEIEAKSSEIHVLVNNAGVTRDGLMLRMEDDAWQEVIDTNLKGTFLFSRAVGACMMRGRYGRIINISSVSGLMGNPGQANYSASKAGIIGFSKTVARELASRGITVNVVAPGSSPPT